MKHAVMLSALSADFETAISELREFIRENFTIEEMFGVSEQNSALRVPT